jgi:hypothetical protein
MRDAPSRILLIVGPYPGFVRDWARRMGLSAALVRGSVRIVTKPGQLRGWRAGTLYHVVGSDQMDGEQRGEFAAALKVYGEKGQLRCATPDDVQSVLDEVTA